MIAAHRPVQRPRDARLLFVDADGRIVARAAIAVRRLSPTGRSGDRQRRGDAAREPPRRARPQRRQIEVRLAGRASLAAEDVHGFRGRHLRRGRLPHAHRGPAAAAAVGSRRSSVVRIARGDHRGAPRSSAAGVAALPWFTAGGVGRARPAWPADSVRARACSARAVGRVDADCRAPRLRSSRRPRALRSTGDRFVPCASAASRSPRSRSRRASRRPATRSSTAAFRSTSLTGFRARRRRPSAARAAGGRVVAVGTTVVRALEHAAAGDGVVRAGDGIANQRLGPSSRLRVVDAILSGTHEPGSSHYQLLRAFLGRRTLAEASAALEAMGYQTHEFGDSVDDVESARAAGYARSEGSRKTA